MGTILIKSAKIIDSKSPYNGEIMDVLITDGEIQKIAKEIHSDFEKIEGGNLHVSPSFTDIGTQICDPGLEHREDLESASKAAKAGGYGTIACFPNTAPTLHSKSQIQYIVKNSRYLPTDFLPIGAVTENCKGKDITEMYDMQASGAVAFSDGYIPIQDSGMMLRALQYVKPFDGVIINHPQDKSTALGGELHEGIISTQLGLKGIPSLSEELMITRDIYLSEYTDSKVHIHNISTAKGVHLVREAKARGLKVTCGVAVLNLIFTDDELLNFNTNFKVLPPLREKSDLEALRNGLKDGTIDCITTNHTPWEQESKDLEFLYAKFGAIGLETTFGLLCKHLLGEFSLGEIINLISHHPKSVLGLASEHIQEGNTLSLTIFNPEEEYLFEESMIQSKSRNSPSIGKKLKGRILSVTG